MGEALLVRRGGAAGEAPLIIEAGLIVEFYGLSSNIPDGWALCDGQNSTPNLTDKFIVGAGDTYAISATGGSVNAVNPTHTHTTGTTNTQGSHSHNWSLSSVNIGGQGTIASNGHSPSSSNTATAGQGNHSHTVSISTVGESGAGKNLPPYLGLFYIIKVEA